MQARRPAVWAALLAVAAATVAFGGPPHAADALSARQAAGAWALTLQTLCPAVFGVLLADRLPRERRLRIDEVLAALPVRPGDLLAGKVVGAAAATTLPLLGAYAAGGVWLAVRNGPAVLPWLVPAFAAIVAPGLAFVAAFSIVGPAFMPVPLYQFLFVGYWFWGNFLPPGIGIPTLSHTILTPVGRTAARVFFAGAGPAAAVLGAASIGLLVGLAGLVLGVASARMNLAAAARHSRPER